MTQNEIIEMATQAWNDTTTDIPNIKIPKEFVIFFANLVAAHEREACAKLCDDLYAEDESVSVGECVAAIRARGQA